VNHWASEHVNFLKNGNDQRFYNIPVLSFPSFADSINRLVKGTILYYAPVVSQRNRKNSK